MTISELQNANSKAFNELPYEARKLAHSVELSHLIAAKEEEIKQVTLEYRRKVRVLKQDIVQLQSFLLANEK